MDRGAWRAKYMGHKESDTTEVSKHTCTRTHNKNFTTVTDFKDTVQWPWCFICNMTVWQW